MPRIPRALLRAAHRISPHLAALLPACRDLASARNELRWIREHVLRLHRPHPLSASPPSSSPRKKRTPKAGHGHGSTIEAAVSRLCRRRAAGTPLQYVLGSQPFGPLDLACRRGVLIPRPETEAWAAHLAAIMRPGAVAARVVDVCSGTGCVALLLRALLGSGLRVMGFDVEPRAVALARANRERNVKMGVLLREGVRFERADVFERGWVERLAERPVDVLVSNPPYISVRGFNRDTGRSVRNFEPRRALVPSPDGVGERPADCAPEDVFYARLLDVAATLRPKIVVFEVGDLDQAVRVVEMTTRRRERWDEVEIWRDWPDMRPDEEEAQVVQVEGRGDVPVRGSGHGRVVFLRRLP
ncbi:S-adenosyl-L-methionine-dependent methyltransferase [Camillea tinctor]|nr:S-adenosyl-L-methionine-dependent methyltransferase [Camillea tinctor]